MRALLFCALLALAPAALDVESAVAELTAADAAALLSRLADLPPPPSAAAAVIDASASCVSELHESEPAALVLLELAATRADIDAAMPVLARATLAGERAEAAAEHARPRFAETAAAGTAHSDTLPQQQRADGADGLPADLDCQCAPAACDCDKACFCGVRTTPYAGHRRAPPAGLGALGALPPEHDCACSMGEVGGPGISDTQNTVDCDCLAAPCECTRKCSCAPKAAAPPPAS